MKVWEIRTGFGFDNFRIGDRPEPEPGPGEVVLRMKAVALNYRDVLTVRGDYNPKQPLPLIPCSDGVGEVVAVGDGVTRVAEGDRVATLFAQRWISGEPQREKLRSTLGGPLDGTLTELMLLDAEGVVPVPGHLSDEEAATLPCAALTAWSAIVTQGETKAGDTVLLLGTGGVSIFALQFARLLGARAVITSSSDAKLQRARELGAWQGINYRQVPEWSRRVWELTGKRGVDLVVEVGGAGTLPQSLLSVRMGGRICLIGSLTGVVTDLDILPIFMRHLRVQGILVGHREGFAAMNRALAAAEIHPVVDRVFPFEQAREAFEYLGAGKHFGKVVITLPPPSQSGV